jgi:hypothetical protein
MSGAYVELETALAAIERLEEELRRKADHPPELCLPPHDGKGALRPHTAKGWWQVWSGGICIALLRPEDIERAGLQVSGGQK